MKRIVSALVALPVLAGIGGSANALEARRFWEQKKHHEEVVQPGSFTVPAAPEESGVTRVQRGPYSNTPGWARKALRMGGSHTYESQLEMRNLRERRMRMMQHRRQMMNGGGYGYGGGMYGRGRGR